MSLTRAWLQLQLGHSLQHHMSYGLDQHCIPFLTDPICQPRSRFSGRRSMLRSSGSSSFKKICSSRSISQDGTGGSVSGRPPGHTDLESFLKYLMPGLFERDWARSCVLLEAASLFLSTANVRIDAIETLGPGQELRTISCRCLLYGPVLGGLAANNHLDEPEGLWPILLSMHGSGNSAGRQEQGYCNLDHHFKCSIVMGSEGLLELNCA